MKRLATLVAPGLLAATLAMPAVSVAATDTGDSSFPLPDGTTLEVHVKIDCPLAEKQCHFTIAPNRRAGDEILGFPDDFYGRQTTTIRSSNQLNYLEAQVVAPNTRMYKEMGNRVMQTIFYGGGPPEKYVITGQIQPTDQQTGQPKLDADQIVCMQIQVVYSGVNITSPSTCAQTKFS